METHYPNDSEEVSKARIQALAQHLDSDIEDAERSIGDYLVLTDEEADDMAEQYILDSVWAFNPSFIASHCDSDIPQDAIEAIQEKCESSNPILLKLIKDTDDFIQDAISSDGRGHFIGFYDGEEDEQEVNGTRYYVYRSN
jgi:hypothetical protein